ncbi:UDP-N-acetylmuramate dehydrogenase [Suttonella ornithocola]|uniref:UDP-N-acetylenolpyruvoylglucosamine reductase n=1 Tax=Suttonella ornithocola TaxID=279832 RepID=A0A380MPR0_9GAMM|nr:UDP-N-acetylmuramate dehydrogenase [Suttonella ornithocola]SUO94600.1 UDP-N-acetylenolpyruvoylglucosamine reductase [Suttonella ornithocola]
MRILRHVPLAPYHALAAIETQADTLVMIEDVQELSEISIEDHILGGGSNTIFVGEVKTRLVKPVFQGITVEKETAEYVIVSALAGTQWHDLVRYTVAQGWYGLENLALIPGTVGAAPVQNIGAYGVECADCLLSVEVYDRIEHCFETLPREACGFAYRQSYFKQHWKNRYLITVVRFMLKKQGKVNADYPGLSEDLSTPKEMFDAVCAIRTRKLPDPNVLPNAGSFFHNPIVNQSHFLLLQQSYPSIPSFASGNEQVKIPAAWLIEQCGLKGVSKGQVGIYENHALVLVNTGGSGKDILQFAELVKQAVADKFNLSLQIEPTIIGDIHE